MQQTALTSSHGPFEAFMARQTATSLKDFDQNALNEAVKAQNYMLAVQLLDSLHSPLLSVDVLNRCEGTLPPFILSEKAFALLDSDPSIEALYKDAIPLIYLDAATIRRDIAGCCVSNEVKEAMQQQATSTLEMSVKTVQTKACLHEIYTSQPLEFYAKVTTLEQLLGLYKETVSMGTDSPPWIKLFHPELLEADASWKPAEALLEVQSTIRKVATEIATFSWEHHGGHYSNPILLAAMRGDSHTIDCIRCTPGSYDLARPQDMQSALKKCDYTIMLKKLWGEPSLDRKLEWLRKEKHQHIPFVPSERAFAEFGANPTLDTLLDISLPLIELNSIILYSNAACIEDETIAALIEAMKELEYNHLNNLAKEKGLLEADLSTSSKWERRSLLVLKEVLESYKEKCSNTSPDWIKDFGSIGMTSRALRLEDSREVQVKSSYPSTAQEVFQDALTHIEKKLSTSSLL